MWYRGYCSSAATTTPYWLLPVVAVVLPSGGTGLAWSKQAIGNSDSPARAKAPTSCPLPRPFQQCPAYFSQFSRLAMSSPASQPHTASTAVPSLLLPTSSDAFASAGWPLLRSKTRSVRAAQSSRELPTCKTITLRSNGVPIRHPSSSSSPSSEWRTYARGPGPAATRSLGARPSLSSPVTRHELAGDPGRRPPKRPGGW